MDVGQILKKYLRQAVRSSTEEVAEHARTHHGFISRPGAELEKAIVARESEDGLTGQVEIDRTKAPYGPYVHQGTKPHIILPVNKKWLRWPKRSNTSRLVPRYDNYAFAKRVKHPGFKGDPFLFNALDAKDGYIEKMFKSRIDAAIEEILNKI